MSRRPTESLKAAELSHLDEIVAPFALRRDKIPPVGQVRSTLLASSRRAVADLGMTARYEGLLPAHHRSALSALVAGIWLDADVALSHYRAMDGLGFSPTEQLEMGRCVGEKLHGNVLAAAFRLVQGAGASPWTPLGQFQRLWGRLFVGGDVQLVKLGPKEARADMAGLALFGVPYFRVAFRGVVASACGKFAGKVYVGELPRFTSATTASFRIAWA